MSRSTNYLALDIGEKRIGLARADSGVRLAYPYQTLEGDDMVYDKIRDIIEQECIDIVVVGFPRNQSGEATAQSDYTQKFVSTLGLSDSMVRYQDESLTSVLAEDRLQSHKKPYTKGDIDMMAASMILQDYLENER